MKAQQRWLRTFRHLELVVQFVRAWVYGLVLGLLVVEFADIHGFGLLGSRPDLDCWRNFFVSDHY
jgi:hypothetical protein